MGERITVRAWQPHTRKPNLAGRHGHEIIPGNGDTATYYLTSGDKAPFGPITPSGIRIENAMTEKHP